MSRRRCGAMENNAYEMLRLENEALKERLREAEDVVSAIRRGEVDALAISHPEGEKIYTLQGADRTYRFIMESMSEGAVTLDRDGMILYGNLRFERMLGIPHTKVIGTSLLDYIPREYREQFNELLRRAAEGSSRGEIRFLGGNGATVPVGLSINGLEIDRIPGFCIIASDLTEQKQVEEELAGYRKHLEGLVAARTKELDLALDEMESRVNERTAELKANSVKLEQMNRELREFFFIASHDLQEPLRKIQTYCSRIKVGGAYEQLPSKARDDFDRVAGSAKKMTELLRAISNFSLVFGSPGFFYPVDLNQTVDQVILDLGRFIQETDARIDAARLPVIEANPQQMHWLFRNLIENALKFRRREPPEIEIVHEVREGTARISIKDNGMGFDVRHFDLIFRPFQRLHANSMFGGTGMGLAICRKIVERHNGTITVESLPGKGSTFVLALPLKQTPAEKAIASPELDSRRKGTEEFLRKISRLEEQSREAQEIISAIRNGEIDALVSSESGGEKIYTLKSVDAGYRVLVESIGEGAVILDQSGSVYYANKRFEQMIRKDRLNVVTCGFIEHILPKDRSTFQSLFRRVGKGGDVKGDIHLKAGDDTVFPVRISLGELRIEDFRGVWATITDLSEYQRHAAELTEINQALETEIARRKRAQERLESSVAEIQRSNRELQDFASIASHDLQEPLRKVKSFGNLLKMKHSAALGEAGVDQLDRMLGATDRMQALLKSLLDYSRISTRAQPAREVDPAVVIRDALSDLEVVIRSTKGEIHLGELPPVHADPVQLGQLFQNLIGNALKFHADGIVPVVHIKGTATEDGFLRITVEDNGIGFEEKHLDKIFGPFQRLHGRSSHYQGTGMGLAICKKIVERHGGSITAKSEPGRGSTFIVTLPLNRNKKGKGPDGMGER